MQVLCCLKRGDDDGTRYGHSDVESGHQKQRELSDDGISHLTADDYKELRMIPMAAGDSTP